MNVFNLSRIKKAQRQEGFPQVFEPYRKDPYKVKSPNDGNGFDRTRGGSEGMQGETPDMGSSQFGQKEREGTHGMHGYPDDISTMEGSNESGNEKKIPSEHDLGQEDAFSGKDLSRSPFGSGIVTDFGVNIHDDEGSPGDSPLGVHSTVGRMMDVDNRDRAFPLGDINSPATAYNLKLTKNKGNLFDRVRKNQRL